MITLLIKLKIYLTKLNLSHMNIRLPVDIIPGVNNMDSSLKKEATPVRLAAILYLI